jgi:hypothetical protein
MAHSYIDFRGRYLHVNDMDLIAIVHLLLFERNRFGDSDLLPSGLAALMKEWESLLDVSGPGCLDLNLDDYINDDQTIDALVSAITRVESELKRFGDTIPGNHLNKLTNSSVIKYEDRPTAGLLALLSSLSELLTHSAQA